MCGVGRRRALGQRSWSGDVWGRRGPRRRPGRESGHGGHQVDWEAVRPLLKRAAMAALKRLYRSVDVDCGKWRAPAKRCHHLLEKSLPHLTPS